MPFEAQSNIMKPTPFHAQVLPIDVHYSAICTGLAEVASNLSTTKLRSGCTERVPCMWVPKDCAWLAHIVNMVSAGVTPKAYC